MKFAGPRIRHYYISHVGGGGGSRGSSVNQIMNNRFFFLFNFRVTNLTYIIKPEHFTHAQNSNNISNSFQTSRI